MNKPPETNLAIIIDHLIVEGVILVVGRLAIEGVWMGVAGVHCYQTAVNTVYKRLHNKIEHDVQCLKNHSVH